ncbi:MAG: hypothetical protein QGH33_13335, partial [Pirellulaceae bacterium]|nr:hypothetical protein [Pirellulaceae bacterium]
MNHRPKAIGIGLFTSLLIATVTCSAGEAPVNSQQFLTDCRALTQDAHRLSGTENLHRASDYIYKRLKTMGLDQVIVQEYPTTQTKVKRCEVVFGDPQSGPVRLILTPMRPNGIIAPVTPPEGVTGPLYHAGAGRDEDFKSGSPLGCLVVLDYNCGRGWIRALRMGAKAVIFVANGQAQSRQSHFFDTNANFLRYYYAGNRSDLPAGVEATIHSEIVWEPAAGRNVFGFIRGSDPVFQLNKEELIIIASNLDSFGEIPRLSPGGRGAANCAGLLKLATYLKGHRPRRHILLAFFDGQARCHTGSSAFYRIFDRQVDIQDRQKSFELEERFLGQMGEALWQEQPLYKAGSARREFVERIKSKAEAHVRKTSSTIHKLRRQAVASGLEKNPLAYARFKSTIGTLQSDKDSWNDLRRALATAAFEQDDAQIANEVESRLRIAFAELAQDIAIRSKELENEGRALASDRALKDLIGDYWINLHISLLIGDRTDRWGLAIGGKSPLHWENDQPGLYMRVQGTFLSAYRALGGTPDAAEHFEPRTADRMLSPPDVLFAAPLLVH